MQEFENLFSCPNSLAILLGSAEKQLEFQILSCSKNETTLKTLMYLRK